MGQSLELFQIPTGLRPIGVDVIKNIVVGEERQAYVIVANSGEDSVSIFQVLSTFLVEPKGKMEGIIRPYGVAGCIEGKFVITSPSQNSVSIIKLPEAVILGTIEVGSEPYSVGCFRNAGRTIAVVSNFGDSSLTLIDVESLSVIGELGDVPGSRRWRGVSMTFGTSSPRPVYGWVAGTEVDQVTIVDLLTLRILTRLSVPNPTSIRDGIVTSGSDNSITGFNETTFEAFAIAKEVPNPQDSAISGHGFFATMGGQDSLWRLQPGFPPGLNSLITTVPDIPGAAAIVAWSSITSPVGPGLVFVTSPDSNRLFVISGSTGIPIRDFNVLDGAHFGQAFAPGSAAPGSLVSAFTSTGVSQILYAESIPLPKQLGGVSVRVGGTLTFDITSGWNYSPEGSVDAPLLFVNPSQVNFQIPAGMALGNPIPVQLQRPDGSTLLSHIQISAASPGIFTILQNGQGQAAALNQDNTQNGNPESIVGAQPAARGSVIQIFATGAGETDPPLLAGEAAPVTGDPLVFTRVQPTVTIGGQPARVIFSGMAPGWVGLWQINAEIPAEIPASTAPGAAVPLSITADGVTSNTVTIAVASDE